MQRLNFCVTTTTANRCLISAAVMMATLLMLTSSCSTPARIADTEARLIQQFQLWEGAPYRLGGQSTSGVDCSAFVQIVMREALGVSIPRTTREQMNTGRRIHPSAARAGDMVFFQTGRTTYHVGIMMRGDFFMHASTNRGVTINRLRETYWRDRMTQIRRVENRR